MLQNDFVEDIDEELMNPTDKRIFAIAAAFHRGYSVDKIWQMTNIDKWFLTQLQSIFKMELRLSSVCTLRVLRYALTAEPGSVPSPILAVQCSSKPSSLVSLTVS